MPCIGQPSLMLLIFFLDVISIMMTKVPSVHGTRGGVCLLLLKLYFPLLIPALLARAGCGVACSWAEALSRKGKSNCVKSRTQHLRLQQFP